jgi:hypothetical protein
MSMKLQTCCCDVALPQRRLRLSQPAFIERAETSRFDASAAGSN